MITEDVITVTSSAHSEITTLSRRTYTAKKKQKNIECKRQRKKERKKE